MFSKLFCIPRPSGCCLLSGGRCGSSPAIQSLHPHIHKKQRAVARQAIQVWSCVIVERESGGAGKRRHTTSKNTAAPATADSKPLSVRFVLWCVNSREQDPQPRRINHVDDDDRQDWSWWVAGNGRVSLGCNGSGGPRAVHPGSNYHRECAPCCGYGLLAVSRSIKCMYVSGYTSVYNTPHQPPLPRKIRYHMIHIICTSYHHNTY